MWKKWLQSLSRNASQRKSGKRRQLLVEQLELRDVPTVGIQSLFPPFGALEGAPVSGSAVFSGSSTNINDYSAKVSWGDGSTDVLNAANGGIVNNLDGTFSVIVNHVYALPGNDTLTVTINDTTGASAVQSAVVSVADAALYGNGQIINGVPNVSLGSTVLATFTDYAAAAGDFSATIAWGDGKTDVATVANGGIVAAQPGQWNILGNHTYATTGAYQVTVITQDADSGALSVVLPTIIANNSPLQVTPYDPATPLSTLTNALVKPNTGINIVGSSFVGQNGQAGTYTGFNFHDQNTSLSLTDGILLTSGSAINAVGPNNQTGATTAYGAPGNNMGDPQLDGMVAPDVTFDANSLTLQFTAAPGVTSIQFQFAFGSEEFPEWVGQYNDLFAVFLDGKQISFDPAGNPISVNNNFFQLNNSNDNTYPAYSVGKTVVAYDIQYDGLTPALTTQAALDPTITTHTLKFAIADTRDQVLDSGAFITALAGNVSTPPSSGGGSAGTTTAPQANAGGPYQVTAGQSVQLSAAGTTDASQAPSTLTYKWDLNGNGIFGETGAAATNGSEVGMTPTFVAPASAAGKSVSVSLQVIDNQGVLSTDQATINVLAPVNVSGPISIGPGPGGAKTLLVNGTAADDVIRIVAHGDKGDIAVLVNGVSQGVFAKASFSAVAVYGLAGNDFIEVDGDVKATVYLFGGNGNDVLLGGGGPSFLDGGAGNDKLTGGQARSVLVGGAGSDLLYAGDSAALLIGGSIDLQSPANLLNAWTNLNQTYADRAAAVRSMLAGHIFDDGQKDVLNSGDGQDLYFYNSGDVLHDKQKGELAFLI